MLSIGDKDPRYLQLLILGSLLVYGKNFLTYFPGWIEISIIFVTTICLQFVACTWSQVRFDPKSATISALSLTLLMRFNALEPILWAVFLAVLSKFVIRGKNGHIYNPTNLAIVIVSLVFHESAWISGGQWGSGVIFAFLLACCGMVVTTGAKRWDISFATLGIWAAMLLGRGLYMGDPLQVATHALTNGGLILFCFFMISDPKTSPNTLIGKFLFAFGTCAVAYVIQFVFYKPHGIFYGLFVMSTLRPFVGYLNQGVQYQWPRERQEGLL